MTNGAKCLLYRFYAFIVYSTPLAILLLINNGYLSNGSKIGVFGIIIISLIIVMFKEQMLTFFKSQPLFITSLVLLFISIVFKYIGDELFYISLCSIIGSVVSMVFGKVANVYENYKYITIDGIKKKNRQQSISDKQAWAEAYGFKE